MKLLHILDSMRNLRVLVIGDLMLDHYVWGDVHRISPEAPVPVVLANRDTWTAGGAANVALNLSALGVKTLVAGRIGKDEAGAKLTRILNSAGIEVVEGSIDAAVPLTVVKSRVVARNQQICRIDRELPRESYRIDQHRPLLSALARALDQCDAVIISDYAKGVVTDALLSFILRTRGDRKKIVAFDPKPRKFASLQGVDLITPNRQEALELAAMDCPVGEKYPLRDVCRRIHELYSPRILAVTLGAEGMAISREGEVEERLPTVAREVFDVSGAGDTVIAVFAAALATGASPFEAAQLANAAAGSVVAHLGTVAVVREELIGLLPK